MGFSGQNQQSCQFDIVLSKNYVLQIESILGLGMQRTIAGQKMSLYLGVYLGVYAGTMLTQDSWISILQLGGYQFSK